MDLEPSWHNRKRARHFTFEQKRRLFAFIKQQPSELITGAVTKDFTHEDAQRIWRQITSELNTMPSGSRKTWKQWRKTWQDLRSKAKKDKITGKIKPSVKRLTPEEQDILSLGVTSTTVNDYNASSNTIQETDTEFVEFEDQDGQEEPTVPQVFYDVQSAAESASEDFLPETKVFTKPKVNNPPPKYIKILPKPSPTKHDCEFNCERMSSQEEKKLQMKEDYYNFKKEYLTQKLQCMREQTEALQTIANNLGSRWHSNDETNVTNL